MNNYTKKFTVYGCQRKCKKISVFLILNCSNSSIFLQSLRGCLVSVFKQQFSVFKQHFTYFNTLFHSHVFPQKFLNNNFQFLNTCTKQALSYLFLFFIFSKSLLPFLEFEKKKKKSYYKTVTVTIHHYPLHLGTSCLQNKI